jgi:hypothetical protein
MSEDLGRRLAQRDDIEQWPAGEGTLASHVVRSPAHEGEHEAPMRAARGKNDRLVGWEFGLLRLEERENAPGDSGSFEQVGLLDAVHLRDDVVEGRHPVSAALGQRVRVVPIEGLDQLSRFVIWQESIETTVATSHRGGVDQI